MVYYWNHRLESVYGLLHIKPVIPSQPSQAAIAFEGPVSYKLGIEALAKSATSVFFLQCPGTPVVPCAEAFNNDACLNPGTMSKGCISGLTLQ